MIEEVGCSNSAFEVGKNVRNVLHQSLLAFQVVEAKQGEVLVDGKEDLAMYLRNGVVAN